MSESNPVDQRSGESDPESESTEKNSTKVSEVSPPKVEEGTVRRALIRATLKPQEGAPPLPRQAPVFTSHQQQPQSGNGFNRGNTSKPRNNRQASGKNNHSKKTRSSRSARYNERGGQPRVNSTSRSTSSNRGKGRSR